MKLLRAAGRIALIVPLAAAGAVAIISTQTAVIFGVLVYRSRERAPKPATPADAAGFAPPSDPAPAAEPPAPAEPEASVAESPPFDGSALTYLPLRPIKPDSLILLPGESCYLQDVATISTADVQRIGGPAGFSIGRTRLSQAQSDGKAYTRAGAAPARGRVYVTNTRLIFVGAVNLNMHIAQILTLDTTATGVSLNFVNEQPVTLTTGNPRLGLILRQVVYRSAESPSL